MLSAKLSGMERLVAQLNAYRTQAAAKIDEALALSAEQIADDAKALAPVASGATRDSIEAAKNSYQRYKVAATSPYALFLEFGTVHMAAQPFLFPSFEKNRNAVLNNLKQALKSI